MVVPEDVGTTQWQFRRAYEDGDIDSDELDAVQQRYDELDADGKQEFDRFVDVAGENGVEFVSDLDADQVGDFFGTACRRASSVSAPPRLRGVRAHSVSQPVAGALVTGGCADDLPASAKQRYYNNIAEAASENSDISASEIIDQVEDIGDADRRRTLKQLFADSGEDGIRLSRNMDADTKETFLDLGTDNRFDNFNRFDEWRTSVAQSYVRTDVASRYTQRVDTAADHPNIDNPGELLEEVADNPRQIRGQSGEAASAIRYADNVNGVEPEPGNGAYDLKVTNGGDTEFVEVKTRTASGFTKKWAGEKIEDINDKYSSAQDDGIIGITEDKSVLELRARGEATSKSSAKETVRDAASDADKVKADEIRVVFEDGDVVSVKSW